MIHHWWVLLLLKRKEIFDSFFKKNLMIFSCGSPPVTPDPSPVNLAVNSIKSKSKKLDE